MSEKQEISLLEMIEILTKTEHFKQDAYFMCGSPSDAPNDDLMNACDLYLRHHSSDSVTETDVDSLFRELQRELESIESGKKKAGRDIPAMIRTILAAKCELL